MSNEVQLQAKAMKSLEAFIDGLQGDKKSALIKVLYQAQRLFGYLPKEVMLFVGSKLGVPSSKVYGVVSFYSYFTTVPKGRCQLKLCLGTACFVRGAQKIGDALERQLGLRMGQTSEDRKYSLEALRCVGACGLAPVLLVDDKVYGKITEHDVTTILKEHQE